MSEGAAGGGKKKAVLIIEDDVFLIKTYQIKLKNEGAEVWVATDGKEAMAFLEKDPPKVVLLDLMLPQISGFDVLGAMRKSDTWKNVPVIILSNLGQPQDIERGKQLGAADYLVKTNVRINDVVGKVKKYL